jgi:transposase-like protein
MRKSRLSWSIQRRLIEHFVSGSTAWTAASLVGVNKSTAAFYFHRLREIISLENEDASPLFGEIEVDESYFGGHRKGKRGRGAGGKIPVFGLLKRGGKVYAKVIPDAKGKTLKAIIEDKVVPRQHRLLRYLQFLQRARCIQFQALPHQPLRAVLRSEESRQRHRELLESDQASYAPFQRHPRHPLLPLLEGVRVAFQYASTKTTANSINSMGYNFSEIVI